MDMNREQFDKLTKAAQQEEKQRKAKQRENANKWELLNRRLGVEEPQPQFPLVQYRPPEGFEGKY